MGALREIKPVCFVFVMLWGLGIAIIDWIKPKHRGQDVDWDRGHIIPKIEIHLLAPPQTSAPKPKTIATTTRMQ